MKFANSSFVILEELEDIQWNLMLYLGVILSGCKKESLRTVS